MDLNSSHVMIQIINVYTCKTNFWPKRGRHAFKRSGNVRASVASAEFVYMLVGCLGGWGGVGGEEEEEGGGEEERGERGKGGKGRGSGGPASERRSKC